MSKREIEKQRQKNYQKLHDEVSRRAYLSATVCACCGHRLPYIGYQHMCSIHIASCYKGPADSELYMKQYISQQMAQMAMQM